MMHIDTMMLPTEIAAFLKDECGQLLFEDFDDFTHVRRPFPCSESSCIIAAFTALGNKVRRDDELGIGGLRLFEQARSIEFVHNGPSWWRPQERWDTDAGGNAQ